MIKSDDPDIVKNEIYQELFKNTEFEFYTQSTVSEVTVKFQLYSGDDRMINGVEFINGQEEDLYLQNAPYLFLQFKSVKNIKNYNYIFKKYNFKYLSDVINLFYTMGKEKKFFKSIKIPEQIECSDFFSTCNPKSLGYYSLCGRNVLAQIYYNEIFFIKNSTSKKNALSGQVNGHLRPKIIDNKIHPIVILTLPFTATKKFDVLIDLFDKPSDVWQAELSKNAHDFSMFFDKLSNNLIKSTFKLSNKEISLLTESEKSDYLNLVSMSKI